MGEEFRPYHGAVCWQAPVCGFKHVHLVAVEMVVDEIVVEISPLCNSVNT